MLVNYISISIRYYKIRPIEGLINIFSVSVAMGSLLICLSNFVNGMPMSMSFPFFICAITTMFLYSSTLEHKRYKNSMKEVGVRRLFGAAGTDLYRQLFVESLIVSFVGALISIAFLDILLSTIHTSGLITPREYLFNLPSMIAFWITIPALSLLIAIYPTIMLLKERESFRLNE